MAEQTHQPDHSWTDPGAWPVADGVYRIPLPLPMDGLRAVNVYAIETDDGLTLIDGGWALQESRQALDKALSEIGYAASDIRQFLVTHAHRDHYTQAIVIRREYGTHVSIGIGERPALQHMIDPPGQTEREILTQLRRCGAPELAAEWSRSLVETPSPLKPWEMPDRFLDGEIEIDVGGRTLVAVPTPGHTQGHYVFHDMTAGLLYAGDHVLPTISPSIGFEPVQARLPLADYLSSLARVRARPDAVLLGAHGPTRASARARVDELLEFHRVRLADTKALVGDGGSTALDVANGLRWTRRERAFAEMGAFDQALAAMETRAHLEVLAAEGEVRSTTVDGVGVYHPVRSAGSSPARPSTS